MSAFNNDDVAVIYESPSLGTIRVTGLYAEIDNRYDKRFLSAASLRDWLSEFNAEFMGVDV